MTEELMQLPGYRRGVPLANNHRGATLENSEYLASKENVQPVELDALNRVFKLLDAKKDDKLDWEEISAALTRLGHKTPKEEIELWIWEVDDDLDNMVGRDEYLTMYQRCISDQTGLEPRNLFNLVQFLMYDRDYTGTISVEQTLQILFVRHGRGELDNEIAAIFGANQKGDDGQELKINLSQFLASKNERLTELRLKPKWKPTDVKQLATSTRPRK
jgi:Ca2+-binding EF-hand superfamily protein